MSVNIMLGPGPSSVATRVMGTGLEENLGWEACREREGRSLSERTDEGRLVLDGREEEGSDLRGDFVSSLSESLSEGGLLFMPPG